jgi:hypothetical protein
MHARIQTPTMRSSMQPNSTTPTSNGDGCYWVPPSAASHQKRSKHVSTHQQTKPNSQNPHPSRTSDSLKEVEQRNTIARCNHHPHPHHPHRTAALTARTDRTTNKTIPVNGAPGPFPFPNRNEETSSTAISLGRLAHRPLCHPLSLLACLGL